MKIVRCALGVIQKKGADVIEPKIQTIGPTEVDYLIRHVDKVRATTNASARSVFATASSTPPLLERLRAAPDDAAFETEVKTLQDALAGGMRTSTNAKDCVFAVVHATDGSTDADHVTILKLDAVVEAAKMKHMKGGGVTFEVLKELLPEPGQLQKALSWPDPRATSEVIVLDTNSATAQYFENAYQVRVSPRASQAESELAAIFHERVPPTRLPQAVDAAAALSGPVDEVLTTLAQNFPELTDAAGEVTAGTRPPGIVRPNKVAALPVVWRADGIEVRVPAHLVGRVEVSRHNDGWRLTIETVTEPRQQ